MRTKLKITIVYDNNSFVKDLTTDWGFSCVVETGQNNILFDTGGNGKILLENMKKLSVDPRSIDVVFLSHFHHDHTGGLKEFLRINPDIKVFYPHSFPKEITDIIIASGAEPVPDTGFNEIMPDVFTLGEIQGKIPEQSIAIHSSVGMVIITGCAHPGINNILEKADKLLAGEFIYLVLGGFHLHRLSDEEINEIIQKILKMKIYKIAPTHCSGNAAVNMFRNHYGENFLEAGAGKVFEI